MKRWFGVTLLAAAMAMGTAAFAQDHGGDAVHEGGFHMPDGINWTGVGGEVVHTVNGREVRSPRPPPFVGPIINFAILLVLGYMAVTRSINPSLLARRASVESEIAEAKRLHDEAQAMHEATARVERMRADGTATIEQELKNLREDLRREAIIAATAAAEATVRSSIGADDQRRLADEYLSGLEAAGTEGARA